MPTRGTETYITEVVHSLFENLLSRHPFNAIESIASELAMLKKDLLALKTDHVG
jgi:hypothetical protein